MNVDMPDETVETDIVDRGQLQIESAFLYNRFREKPNARIGKLLVRYGLMKRLELRIAAEDGRQRDRYIEETVQSNYPLSIGGKISLLKNYRSFPDISIAGTLKLPFTSRSNDQSPYWSPILLIAFQNKSGDGKWKLEYNAGIQQEAYSTDWVYLVNGSLHYKLTEPLEIFAEYYSQFQPGESPQHNVGGGLALQLGNSVELYISGGSSVDYADYNYFGSGGIAFRTHR